MEFKAFVSNIKAVARHNRVEPVPHHWLVTLWYYTTSFAGDYGRSNFNPRLIRAAAYCGLTKDHITMVMAAWLREHSRSYSPKQWQRWRKAVLEPMCTEAEPYRAMKYAVMLERRKQKL